MEGLDEPTSNFSGYCLIWVSDKLDLLRQFRKKVQAPRIFAWRDPWGGRKQISCNFTSTDFSPATRKSLTRRSDTLPRAQPHLFRRKSTSSLLAADRLV